MLRHKQALKSQNRAAPAVGRPEGRAFQGAVCLGGALQSSTHPHLLPPGETSPQPAAVPTDSVALDTEPRAQLRPEKDHQGCLCP